MIWPDKAQFQTISIWKPMAGDNCCTSVCVIWFLLWEYWPGSLREHPTTHCVPSGTQYIASSYKLVGIVTSYKLI